MLAQFVRPQIVVTDNGSSFVSPEFELFLKVNGFKNSTGAPYNPASNGLTELAVLTFKAGFKKMKNGFLVDKLSTFLFAHSNTTQTTGVAPSEILFGLHHTCVLDLIKPALDLIKPDLHAHIGQKSRFRNLEKVTYKNNRFSFCRDDHELGELCAKWFLFRCSD